MLNLEVYRKDPRAFLPVKGEPGAAAWDIRSMHNVEVYPGQTVSIHTGLVVRPPEGYHTKIYARSGWGKKYGIGIPHGCGIIDRTYCGPNDELIVVLMRSEVFDPGSSHEERRALFINTGDRIAQLMIEKTNDFELVLLDKPPSEISRGGFGSTGVT